MNISEGWFSVWQAVEKALRSKKACRQLSLMGRNLGARVRCGRLNNGIMIIIRNGLCKGKAVLAWAVKNLQRVFALLVKATLYEQSQQAFCLAFI